MKLSVLFLSVLTLISCGSSGGGGGDDGITKREFASPHDPCIENPADCKAVSNISLDQAIELVKNTPQTQPLEVGLQYLSETEEDESVWAWVDENNNGNYDEGESKTFNCNVSYNEARTILRFDQKYVYVEEVKSNFRLQPDDEICKQVLTYDRYKKNVIAKEDNYYEADENGDITQENRDLINRYFVIKRVEYKGEIALRISGTIESEVEMEDPEGGAPIKIKGKSSLFTMSKLGHTMFSNSLINHSISKWEDEKATSIITKNGKSKTGVDTSHIDLDTMDPSVIVDRTDSDNKKQKMNIFGL